MEYSNLLKLKVRKKIREAVIYQLQESASSEELLERYQKKKESILISAENLSCVKKDWVLLLAEDVKKLISLLEKSMAEALDKPEIVNLSYAALLYFEKDDDIVPDYNLLFKGLQDDAVAISYVIAKIHKELPALAQRYRFSDELIEVI
jgi:uncharacterized membrane protein YkvA (DUF1232 family)